MDWKIVLGVVFLAQVSGISSSYWLQAIINNRYQYTIDGHTYDSYAYLGVEDDPATFGCCVVTSLLSIAAITLIMIKDRYRHLGKVVLALVAAIEVVWIVMITIYLTSKHDFS